MLLCTLKPVPTLERYRYPLHVRRSTAVQSVFGVVVVGGGEHMYRSRRRRSWPALVAFTFRTF